jgi:hypothetical protein
VRDGTEKEGQEMSEPAWKQFERRIAAFFNTVRKPLSGGAHVIGRSDSQHERLFIECKLRAKSPIHRLFAETEAKAKKEGKTPILALQEKYHEGWLLVCRPQDIHKVHAECVDCETLPQPGGE